MPNLADKWSGGVASEVAFWQGWLKTKGGKWPDDYRARFDPETPFDGDVEKAIRRSGPGEVEILDVGAGPITSLGYVSKVFDIRITATDPLADAYSILLRDAGVTPPIRTQKCFAENLLQHFGSQRFHVCHSQNALDHSIDPRSAILAMAQLLNPNGLLYIKVYKNEGENARYDGLHSWNFDRDAKNNFILWSGKEKYIVNEDVSNLMDCQPLTDLGHHLVFVAYRKTN